MSVELKNNVGNIVIEEDVIASVVGGAAVECYGIIGMASRHQVRDGIAEILRRDNYSKGVDVTQQDGKLIISLYIIVMYGTKISEIASNVQSAVKYQVENSLQINVDAINVYVQGVRVVVPE